MGRSGAIRLAVGIAISAIFLGITLSRVDLGRAAAAIGAAAPLGLAAAVTISLVDLSLRALRWQTLLRGIEGSPGPTRYRTAFGYLSIGFLANAALPARLGDVARAYLAGTGFRIPRLAIFGTIMIERVSDGLTMLALAVLSSLAVAGIAELRDLTFYGGLLAGAGLLGAIVAWLILTRTAIGRLRIASIVRGIAGRLAVGAGALRQPRSALLFLALTATVTTTAVLVAWAVLRAVGVELSPLQTVLFLSGIALSLAIPAAPGSLGTYEFVGVAIITSLGYSAEQGLATILLMRVVTTFPPVICGVISLFAMGIRPGSLVASRDDPAASGPATSTPPLRSERAP